MSDAVSEASFKRALAEIDRMQAETRKFVTEQSKLAAEASKLAAEQNKLAAEASKFAAEQNKLAAEADKFRRDRVLAPILAAGALGGAVAALLALLTRAFGGH